MAAETEVCGTGSDSSEKRKGKSLDRKKECIIIAGPTGVGKSSLSIRVARALHGAILSVDSMQVYRFMNIGSAKIMPDEREGIPHYMIDVVDPETDFNVASFCKMAETSLQEIYASSRLPILTGGTGFYIQALLKKVHFGENETSQEKREYFKKYAEEHGSEALHELLRRVDPESAAAIHPNNRKRVIRALEFFEESGQKMSEHNRLERSRTPEYTSAYFVITDEREKLCERIDRRVDRMIADGLVEEVRSLLRRGVSPDHLSMQGIGYREMIGYLRGECTLSEAVEQIKKNTRRYAKRQLSWFRREKDAIWIHRGDYHDDEERICDAICGRWAEIRDAG